jgi:hypothetical protein
MAKILRGALIPLFADFGRWRGIPFVYGKGQFWTFKQLISEYSETQTGWPVPTAIGVPRDASGWRATACTWLMSGSTTFSLED